MKCLPDKNVMLLKAYMLPFVLDVSCMSRQKVKGL